MNPTRHGNRVEKVGGHVAGIVTAVPLNTVSNDDLGPDAHAHAAARSREEAHGPAASAGASRAGDDIAPMEDEDIPF